MSLPSVRSALLRRSPFASRIASTRFNSSSPVPPPTPTPGSPPPTSSDASAPEFTDPASRPRYVPPPASTLKKAPIVNLPPDEPLEPKKRRTAVMEKDRVGMFNWRTAAIFATAGTGLYYYFETEKAKMDEIKRKAAAQKSVKTGKPLIGGPFSLYAQDGSTFTEANLLGQWTLMYFGFTNCPDICPEELDKMSDVVDILDKKHGPIARPVFVSCDPARDDIPQVKKYVAEFHPRTIGLTGPYDAIKHMCKVYRVYFSTPPKAVATDDYLVDHSIYFYLLDPDGAFVEAFGKDVQAEEVASKVEGFLEEWKEHARLAKRLGEM